jgi:hypothetical protein
MNKINWLFCIVSWIVVYVGITIFLFFAHSSYSWSWEIGTDVNGMKYLRQTDEELSIITAFGYDDSKDCTDLKFVSINGYPKEYAGLDLPANNILLYMGTKTLKLAEQKPAKLVSGDVVAFVYKHTPTVRMITEFMNYEGVFFWKDASMEPGTYARFYNKGFTEKINEVMKTCVEKVGNQQPATKNREGQTL